MSHNPHPRPSFSIFTLCFLLFIFFSDFYLQMNHQQLSVSETDPTTASPSHSRSIFPISFHIVFVAGCCHAQHVHYVAVKHTFFKFNLEKCPTCGGPPRWSVHDTTFLQPSYINKMWLVFMIQQWLLFLDLRKSGYCHGNDEWQFK